MSILMAMLMLQPGDPEKVAAAAFEKCMLDTGRAWATGTDGADIIARAVRSKCGPRELELRDISLAGAKPHWDARQKAAHRDMVIGFVDAMGDGLQNKVEAMVVERRAGARR